MAVQDKWVAVSGANVRTGPGLTFNAKYALGYGTYVTIRTPPITNPSDGLSWSERNKFPGYWMASKLLQDTNPDAFKHLLQVGAHLSMFNYSQTDFLNLLRQMRATGYPMPCLTVLGPAEIIISDVIAASPETELISRVYYDGDGGFGLPVDQYFRQYVDGDIGRRRIRFHQWRNENTDISPTAIARWKQELGWVELHGFRGAAPTWPTGTPEIAEFQRPDFLDLMRYVRDHGHRFAIHEYFRNDGDWELMRFLHHVYPTLPSDLRNNMPQIRITEWGVQGGRDIPADAWMNNLKDWQTLLMPYPFVKVSTWAIGDTGGGTVNWQGDNYANKMWLMLQLSQWLAKLKIA